MFNQVFADAGFLEDDGTLSKFGRYDDISRFLLVRAADGSVVSAVRTVDATPMGFSALHSVPIDDRGWDAVTRAGLDMITEVVTLSSSRPLHYMGSSTVGALFDLSDVGESSVREAALGTKMLASAGSPQN